MPITEIQADILKVIACNRNPDSYLAGATIVHKKPDSPRYSKDLDFFHDLADQVAMAGEADAKALVDAGYQVKWLLRTPSFYRAVVFTGDHTSLKIEWAQDSTFRFFPVQPDELCGYRLHDADAATNKVLALAGRNELRDFVDVLYLDETYLSLGAMIWAACGKDPGYTPDFLLDQAARHTSYAQQELDLLLLKKPMNMPAMKQQWLQALERARDLIASLPREEIGCLYLDADGVVVDPDPSAEAFAGLTRHRGSMRGAWPTLS